MFTMGPTQLSDYVRLAYLLGLGASADLVTFDLMMWTTFVLIPEWSLPLQFTLKSKPLIRIIKYKDIYNTI